jgi:hypothetical protein
LTNKDERLFDYSKQNAKHQHTSTPDCLAGVKIKKNMGKKKMHNMYWASYGLSGCCLANFPMDNQGSLE